MRPFRLKKDLSGTTVGRLKVLSVSSIEPTPTGRRVVYKCRCYCGKETEVFAANLIRRHTLSCGCFRDENCEKRSLVHGFDRRGKVHPIYQAWAGMLKRCYNPRNAAWDYYGGRGIKVCRRWWRFINFLKDVIGSWRRGLSIDRFDNDGNYSPSNCRWATSLQQQRNRNL